MIRHRPSKKKARGKKKAPAEEAEEEESLIEQNNNMTSFIGMTADEKTKDDDTAKVKTEGETLAEKAEKATEKAALIPWNTYKNPSEAFYACKIRI